MKTTFLSLGLILIVLSFSSIQAKDSEIVQVANIKTLSQSNGVSDYMKLKDALVATNASAAKDAAVKLILSATAENWDADIIKATKIIANSEDVEVQRAAFKTVTNRLIESLKENDLKDGVYVQYCPMAFNNSGANWLSLSDDIKNPYFGNKMLKCGRVIEEL